jgi:predicted permease
MSILSDVTERIRSLLQRGREERDMQEELQQHVELETERLLRAGLEPAEARRRAALSFGGLDRIGEEVRDARGVRPLEDVARDVRHAFRTLGRRRGFTFVAITTLAIGIGASTAMFTLVNSVLLQPVTYPEAERLVAVWELPPGALEGNLISPANLNEWRDLSTSFEGIAAWADRPANLTGDGEPVEIQVRWALDNFFTVLRAGPLLGRTLQPGDDGSDVAVLSYGLWQSRFGADPGIIGRTIHINDYAFEVVGVLPARLTAIHGKPDAWLSMPEIPRDARGRFLSGIARLRAGVPLDAARAEMVEIASRLSAQHPEFNLNWSVRVVPLQEEVTGKARPALLVLLGAVALLLLIACANVASLFLGRATTRAKEMAVRRSLGAGRLRLIVHTMAEALVIACVAGALGLLLAWWAVATFAQALPPDLALPRLDEISVDYRVLAFAFVVSLLTGVLFGIAPALAASRAEPGGVLRETTRGSTGGRSPLRAALIVAQVALAVVLLAGAGLLVRTVHNLMQVDAGMRAEGVLTTRLTIPGLRYAADVRPAFMDDIMMRIAANPGVTAAGAIGWLPLSGPKSATGSWREDRPVPAPGEEQSTDVRIVAGDYFAAIGQTLLRGRVFDRTDGQDAPRRYVINQALAQRLYPGEDPIGRRLVYDWDGEQAGEIIGVVGSVRETALDEEPSPALYRAYAQDPWPQMTIVVRGAGDLRTIAAALPVAIRDADPDLPVSAVRPLNAIVRDTIARQRLSMLLLAGFAGVSLALVLIGLYGVISYSVVQRTREIGVRMALGAKPRDVLRMVISQGMLLTMAGLLLGIAGALALSRVLGSLLYGVMPGDPGTMTAAAALLAATALVASALPAARATRIHPAEVLGSEQ